MHLGRGVWMAGTLLGTLAFPQDQKPVQPPVFGTGVDVVAVDVNVVDGQGRPVPDLEPADFAVGLDGQPRRVVSVEFLALGHEPEDVEPQRPAHFSTNAGVVPGRLVVLAVDQGSIPAGEGRLVMDAAKLLLERLTPADRVALLAFPQPTLSVDFTADLGKIRDALGRLVGRSGPFSPKLQPTLPATFSSGPSTGLSPSVSAALTRQQSQQSTDALRGLLRGLRQIETVKSVVLISGGAWTETPETLRELAELAAEARVTLYALEVEPPLADASSGASASQSLASAGPNAFGLQALTGLTRGEIFRVSGSGRAPFERIARELQGYYLLGFAPEPGDRDGRSHELRVSVARPGLTVRARARVRIAAAPGQDAGRSAQSLQSLLGAPYLSSNLQLRVATFARPPAAGSDGTRVLISAEIGRSQMSLQGVSVGYRLIDSKGQVVRSERRTPPPAQGDGPLAFRSEIALPPGLYTLRLAALDDRERHGSVEHPVKAAAIVSGTFALSDLMLQPGELTGDAPLPVVDLESAAPFVAVVEAQTTRAEGWRDAAAVFELARSEDGAPLETASAQTAEVGPGRRLFSATFDPASLEPGEYWARAVLRVGGRPIVQAARPFRRP